MTRLIARAVCGASGMVTTLPPWRVIVTVPVAGFQIEVLNVGAGGLGDSQPVRREQRDQRVLCRRPEPGGYQWRAELVAVERGGVGLVVRPRTTGVRGG